jgi:hypothetical protein
MMNNLVMSGMSSNIVNRIGQVIKREGLIGFIRILLYSNKMLGVFMNELTIEKEFPFKTSKIDNLQINTIFIPGMSLQEYEILGNQGYDFSTHPEIKKYTKQEFGMIIFWVTVNGSYVHRTGFTNMKKDTVYDLMSKKMDTYDTSIDKYDSAFAGFSETNTIFQGKGVYSYSYPQFFSILRELGFKRVFLGSPNFSSRNKEHMPGLIRGQKRMGSVHLFDISFSRYFYIISITNFLPELKQE